MQVRNTSRIVTTPESIVREFRIANRQVRVEIPVDNTGPKIWVRRGSIFQIHWFEKAVRIFLILATGWVFGYLHHFLSGR